MTGRCRFRLWSRANAEMTDYDLSIGDPEWVLVHDALHAAMEAFDARVVRERDAAEREELKRLKIKYEGTG